MVAVFKRGRVYWFKFVWNGQRIQQSTKQRNATVARTMEAAFRTSLAKGEVGIVERKKIPTFRTALSEFLKWSEATHQSRKSTFRRYQVSSVALKRHFTDRSIDKITSEDVENFKAQRRSQVSDRTGRPIKPATVNRELACLKAMYNHALKADLPIRNPVSKVRFCEENNEQTRTLSYAEQELYLSKATATLADVAILMLETGMRPEEVYRIRRTNLNLREHYLLNPFGKTKAARRRIPLTTAAREVLERRHAATDDYLFPCETDATRPIPKVNNAHDRAVRDSGVDPFRLYDLRHTWATRAAMSGIDLVTLAALLGHSRIQMVLRYAHPTQSHQHDAIRKLEKFMAEQRDAAAVTA